MDSNPRSAGGQVAIPPAYFKELHGFGQQGEIFIWQDTKHFLEWATEGRCQPNQHGSSRWASLLRRLSRSHVIGWDA